MPTVGVSRCPGREAKVARAVLFGYVGDDPGLFGILEMLSAIEDRLQDARCSDAAGFEFGRNRPEFKPRRAVAAGGHCGS